MSKLLIATTQSSPKLNNVNWGGPIIGKSDHHTTPHQATPHHVITFKQFVEGCHRAKPTKPPVMQLFYMPSLSTPTPPSPKPNLYRVNNNNNKVMSYNNWGHLKWCKYRMNWFTTIIHIEHSSCPIIGHKNKTTNPLSFKQFYEQVHWVKTTKPPKMQLIYIPPKT